MMKRYGLLLTTLGMALLTICVLRASSWFAQPARETDRQGHAHARPADPLASEAALRYRQCQPHHWRYLMLSH
jgi:hypothetical protein